MKYLQTEDRQEQRGRAEDGQIGFKHKWTDWPHVTPGADLVSSPAKKVHKKAAGKASAKPTVHSTNKSSSTQASSGATKK